MGQPWRATLAVRSTSKPSRSEAFVAAIFAQARRPHLRLRGVSIIVRSAESRSSGPLKFGLRDTFERFTNALVSPTSRSCRLVAWTRNVCPLAHQQDHFPRGPCQRDRERNVGRA